jgi:long-chain acyl-CoA synthetase
VATLDGREAHDPPAPPSLTVSFLLSDLERPTEPSPEAQALRVMRLDELERLGEGLPEHEALVTRRVEALTRSSLATLQYTSGTTGEPKGVMLTHGNLLSNCEGAIEAVPVGPSDTLLSFLPLSHAFERLAGYYMPVLFGGAQLYFTEGLGHLIRYMHEVRPTIITGIPRIYEKVYARFRGARGPQGAAQRALLQLVLKAERAASEAQRRGETPPAWVDKQRQLHQGLLFKELRARLGGRLRFMVSGGAPLAEEVAEFFHAAGILILEGYGLSEASPVLSVNRPQAYRFGSVGRPLFNVTLKVADDGELLAKGPNLTQGYLNKPAETEALFDEEGWLHTGDIGRVDEAGFVYLTDRKKDIFKTANGKMIAPQFIERALNSSPFIEQAYVVGDRRPYCVALILPSSSELELWAEREGHSLGQGGMSAWAQQPEVRALIDAEVKRVNRALARHEAIKDFSLCGEPFDRFNTASLKLKRRAISEAYADKVEALYQRPQHRAGWRERLRLR